jgi:hypothetical protein
VHPRVHLLAVSQDSRASTSSLLGVVVVGEFGDLVDSAPRSCASPLSTIQPEVLAAGGHAGVMGRIDYYHDPNAPKANSVVPSTTAAVRDNDGRLLLIHKVDNDL